MELLIARINEQYSEFFKRMGCAGQVALFKDPVGFFIYTSLLYQVMLGFVPTSIFKLRSGRIYVFRNVNKQSSFGTFSALLLKPWNIFACCSYKLNEFNAELEISEHNIRNESLN